MRSKFAPIAKTTKFFFKGKVWKFKGTGGWYFVDLPKRVSKKIRKTHGLSEEGWGRLKTTARLGKSKWDTAIWYDTKFQSYLLPVKASVRKSEKIVDGTIVAVELLFEDTTGRVLGLES